MRQVYSAPGGSDANREQNGYSQAKLEAWRVGKTHRIWLKTCKRY
jgi:hypothetical protein